MTRLFKDMDAAQERMLRDPVAFTDTINSAISKAERGAHRHKYQGIAMCVGIAREVCKDFALFEELREAACLLGYRRVQAATEVNFKKFVPFAVAVRSFDGTEATEDRIRVYGYVTGYFAKKTIAVPKISNKIEEMEGIEKVYEKMKAKKREARELLDEAPSAASNDTESRTSQPDMGEAAAAEPPGASGEREPARPSSSKAPDERLTVKAILKKYLLIDMQSEEELERYRDGSARRGQRRHLETVYGGTDTNGLHVWKYVYSRDVDADLSSQEDNDNDVDYEDEDAA